MLSKSLELMMRRPRSGRKCPHSHQKWKIIPMQAGESDLYKVAGGGQIPRSREPERGARAQMR